MGLLGNDSQKRPVSDGRSENFRAQGIGTVHDAEAFLAAIVESSDDAIVSKNLNGIITTWNKGAEHLFGYSAIEAVGRPVTLIIPDDRLDEEPLILSHIQAGERVQHFETVRRRKDGTLVDISLTISPIKGRNGEIIGASKIARDISERKRAAEHQELLLKEMRHRVKNVFAITGGIISLAVPTAQTPRELAADVRSKLLALSRAHEFTLRDARSEQAFSDQAGTLFQLLSKILAPFEIEGKTQWRLHGDDLAVGAQKLTDLALLFHEFATNAAKYGCLSIAEGRLNITVAIKDDLLVLNWVETNGPRLHPQCGQGNGFGSRLEQTVAQSLQAEISRDWHSRGLSIRLIVPSDIVAAS